LRVPIQDGSTQLTTIGGSSRPQTRGSQVTMNSVRSMTLAAALVAAVATPAAAQSTPLTPGQPYHQTIAINAVGLPFGLFSGDIERAVSPAITLSLGGTSVNWGDSEYDRWVDLKGLYYPGEEALKGFAVGVTLGYHSAQDTGPLFDFEGTEGKRQDSGATLGVVLDYNWLLGKKNRFLVGLGLGAKRVLKNVDEDNSPLTQVLPSGRFSIGLAF
jgi:hypothetical protein